MDYLQKAKNKVDYSDVTMGTTSANRATFQAIAYALIALVEELRKDNVPDKFRQQVVSGDGNISGISQSIG